MGCDSSRQLCASKRPTYLQTNYGASFDKYAQGGDIKSCLKMDASPSSEPEKNEILVEVEYAAVSKFDVDVIKGKYRSLWNTPLPMRLGYEFSGWVVKRGDNVTVFDEGDDVFGANWGSGNHGRKSDRIGGAFSQYILVDTTRVTKRPPKVSGDVAAAAVLPGLTAVQAINAGNVQPGNFCVVLGGDTPVGYVLIQLLKLKKARVMTTCLEENVELCRDAGADILIDSKSADWASTADLEADERQGISFVVNCLDIRGVWRKANGLIAEGGSYIELETREVKGKQRGFEYAGHIAPRCIPSTIKQLGQMISNGTINVLTGKTPFPATKAGVVAALAAVDQNPCNPRRPVIRMVAESGQT